MKGRWAAGIVPRNFTWIIKDQLAVSERPGGYAPHHRRVRRHEEILWLNGQGFNRVVSLLPSSHNLHAYEELGLPSAHFPLPVHGETRETLAGLYPALLGWLGDGERILIHQEELGERVSGVIAGFLCWMKMLPEPPRAISVVENLLKRQMGAAGRSVVAISLEVPPPPPRVVAKVLAPPDGDASDRPAEPDSSSAPAGDAGTDATVIEHPAARAPGSRAKTRAGQGQGDPATTKR